MPYSYGYAILTLTLLVKVVTFPLTKKQVEGSIQMQAIPASRQGAPGHVRKRPRAPPDGDRAPVQGG